MATTTATRDDKGRFTKASGRKANGHAGNGAGRGFVVAGAAVGGAALGLLAMFGRKAIVQAPDLLADDWLGALVAEHRAVMKTFDAIEATADNMAGRRTMLLSHLKATLTKHAIEEESVIYPALRQSGQREAADELNREHGYVKQALYELGNMPAESPEWMAKLRKFRSELEAHVKEEEERLFPMLREVLSEERNKALTKAVNREGFKVA
ncbi:hemerythrin domain-containing protein [Sphingomonas sp.]|uniref:hemerythrin domain-containing protein n=1 Tax=Sphingomonas sp. TaxID=28214 RepID=UPI001B049EF3|nr:hemerythrin domain-containing protein [Sphingomonas sp.]MBO9712608.1 hemerythrin domain-containing protein [Sphingomonas sp.]